MHVNPKTSMQAAKRLVQQTHVRVQGRTSRVEQAFRHQREQRDRAERTQCPQCGSPHGNCLPDCLDEDA